ncbi:MAG: alpha/beta fold hydrolase [Solirubrobacterales bacterium]|nr:alpha/beta fold hydrolase [Solirubrobacterales bacterium]MBV9165598.1 alpha/beta fold hydrolase [Solirubrobacterales bacterium]
MPELLIEHGGVSLAAETAGWGPPVVLLHGLTATRRYVVMGSKALERSNHNVIAYDARGHGRSSPAPDARSYGYEELGEDLVAVLDELEIERAVVAGASMGAHTALWLALHRPDRVAALVVITPGYDPAAVEDGDRLARWDALSEGLRDRGVEGFLEAYGEPRVPEAWRETVIGAIRQRMALHEHPEAVADALKVVPRSRPFGELEELSDIPAPTVVIASADEPDPEHPQALAQAYAEAIPGARLIADRPGRSPLAWQGSQLSKVIASAAGDAFG